MSQKKFDSEWYLKQYPDVKKSNFSALEHYKKHGRGEGRFSHTPGVIDYLIVTPFRCLVFFKIIVNKICRGIFSLLTGLARVDTEWYLKRYPDVANSGISPKQHYKFFGKAEGRLPHAPSKVDKLIARSRIFLKVFLWLSAEHKSYFVAATIFRNEYQAGGFTGLKHFVVKTFKLYEPSQKGVCYKTWLNVNENSDIAEIAKLAAMLEQDQDAPLISVVMATYNTPITFLKAALDSVLKQPYKKWELCIADDKSTSLEMLTCLKEYELADNRIKVIYRDKNGHISEATNSALTLVAGDYIAFMDHDDELHPVALVTIAQAVLNNPLLEFIYSDEDKIDEAGNRSEPHFKSDFNYELLLTQNYVCHLTVVKAALVKKLGGLDSAYNGAQDHDFVLRIIEQIEPSTILHIPRVLYHWRIHSASTAASSEAKPYAIAAGRKAVMDHLTRVGTPANVIQHPNVAFWHKIKFDVSSNPRIEIIIPTRDRVDLMRMCINSILIKTTFNNYHITIVDNGSVEDETSAQFDAWVKTNPTISVVRDDSPFNYSRLNNQAAFNSTADLVCLLNNDIEIISPDWLEEMAGHAMREGVGCVGARLWYPNDTLQHGGVILGIGGVAGHSHKYWNKNDPGYFGRALSLQAFSAVTAACLMIKRSIYEEVGGLDEKMQIAFNDVDFCLRVREAGYRNVWTPFAEMYHHESASRGYEDNPEKVARFNAEVDFMKNRWGRKLTQDPYYSPNLTLDHENFDFTEVSRAGQK